MKTPILLIAMFLSACSTVPVPHRTLNCHGTICSSQSPEQDRIDAFNATLRPARPIRWIAVYDIET